MRPPTRVTRTDTLFPYTSLCRARLQGREDREAFHRLVHPRLAADAGGVDQAVLAAVAFEVDRDRVARGAGDFRGDHPLLAQDAVDQGRLAHVRAANEGHAHALRVVVTDLRVALETGRASRRARVCPYV